MSRAEHLRPSSAATWIVCTGNVAMRAAFPDAPDEADTDIREDGTACHWLSAEIWNDRYPQEDSLSPNGRVLTEEMFEGVDLYHDVLNDPKWADAETYCELPVSCSVIYPGMQGTPDAFTILPPGNGRPKCKLRVADLKFGFRFVEVFENWQLIVYALALAHVHLLPPDTEIELVIVQPRCNHREGPVRRWTTTLADLEPFKIRLQRAAARAMAQNVEYVVNPGCRDCAGRHACVSLQNAALGALETAYGGLPHELTVEALAAELSRLEEAEKYLTARITGLSTQADNILRSGGYVPGYELAATWAREGWREGTEHQVIALGQHFGVTLHKPLKPITPNQARKIIPSNLVGMFAHRASTGVKLKQIDPNAARKGFGAIPITQQPPTE